MRNIETSKHLFQAPRYLTNGKESFKSFEEALKAAPNVLTIDEAAVASYLSFGFVTGDRTLFNEIKRTPWLSRINEDDNLVLEDIPKHDFFGSDYKTLASKYYNLLLNETRTATLGFEKVYVLLSGGLDSRIVAGLVNHLYKKGEIKNKPIGVTWGLENSRDVYYGKKMAELLEFDWEYIPISPSTVKDNINIAGKDLGLIHSPELLHNMNWLNDYTSKNSIVLAGSYGDSIGRGEFGGKQLLQLSEIELKDDFGLLTKEFKNRNYKTVNSDISNLYKRSRVNQDYARIEMFMQGFRMRNGLCNAISIINKKSQVYQMFTAPEVYSFIWSLHPSLRGDEIYENLLEMYFPRLARIPWARTNKALSGKTLEARNDLVKEYHLYTKWSRDELRNYLENIIDIDWFVETNLFNKEGLLNLKNTVRTSKSRIGRTNEFWLWLAGFKVLCDYVNETGKKVSFNVPLSEMSTPITNKKKQRISTKILYNYVSKSERISALAKKARKIKRELDLKKIKQNYLDQYPIKKFN